MLECVEVLLSLLTIIGGASIANKISNFFISASMNIGMAISIRFALCLFIEIVLLHCIADAIMIINKLFKRK